jgi:CRISP-associated protein Cas1
MRMHLNVLYVMTQGASVLKEGETLAVRIEDKTRLRVPIHTLASLVTFGQVWCSPQVLAFCSESGVSVSMLSERGRFLARVEGVVSGNVLLRRTQYRWADDDDKTARAARTIVLAKLANSRTVLLRGARDTTDPGRRDRLTDGAAALERAMGSLRGPQPLDVVRGYEGDGAHRYFEAFDALRAVDDLVFEFQGRSKRPPTNPVNAMLSFCYALLQTDIRAALEVVGLDPQVGFLHRDRPGRLGLAFDLMEEHRSWLADRLTWSLINRKQLSAAHFEQEPTGGVFLTDEGRRLVVRAWQERKEEEVQHPFLQERMPVALILQVQARLFAKVLRGELDEYPAFAWR